MTTLKDLANREYISFSGNHVEKETELHKIWTANGSQERFDAFEAEMQSIRDDAHVIRKEMLAAGYEPWPKRHRLPFHYLCRNLKKKDGTRDYDTAELVTDHNLKTQEKGVHIYHVDSNSIDDFLEGKSTLGLWDALKTAVFTYAAAGALVYMTDIPDSAYTTFAGLSAAMGALILGTGFIEKRRMKPTLMRKGTGDMPNKVLADLLEVKE